MSTNLVKEIAAKAATLPIEQQQEVLALAEKLAAINAAPQKSMWAEVREIMQDMPEEVWEQMPRDGAEQHDHYLYGSPKK